MVILFSDGGSIWGFNSNDRTSEARYGHIHTWRVCEELIDVSEGWWPNIWQCHSYYTGNDFNDW